MKPTTYVLVGSLAAGLSFSASGAWAAPGVASGLTMGSLAMSQATPSAEASQRSEAERLLRQAREAIARGDLTQAERLAAQAESLNARYDQIFERFVDTPAKVRATIADRRATGGAPQRPSERFAPAATAAGSRGTTASAPQNHRDARGALDLLTNDATSRARAFLEKGRLAMQQGDLTGAIAWRQKALATGAQFAPGEYSPEALAQELRRAGVAEEQLAVRASADGQFAAARPDDYASEPHGTLPAPRGRERFGDPKPNAAYPVARSTTPAAPPSMAGGAEPRRLPQPLMSAPAAKTEVLRLLAQARAALDRGDARAARQLAEQAQSLGVPEEAFGPNEPRPEHLLLLANSALNRQLAAGGPPAFPVTQAYDPGIRPSGQYPVRQSLYEPGRDGTRNMLAQSEVPSALADQPAAGPLPATAPAPSSTLGPPNQSSPGYDLYQKGIQALEQQDRKTALELFSEAWKHEAELDPLARQALRDKLTLLRSASPPPPGTALAEVTAQQQMLSNKVFRDISRELSSADKLRESDPRGALQRLQKLREQVEQEHLDAPARKQYLTMIDRGLRDTELYLEQHRGDIEMKERNQAAAESIDRRRQEKVDVQTKVAQLNEEFNDLMDQKRYAEAEVKARQASELEPQSEVVRSMLLTSRLAHRVQEQDDIKDAKEKGFYEALTAVDKSSIPFDDTNPLQYDAKKWEKLSRGRADRFRRDHSRLTPTELEIQKSLKTPVEARFENRPLSEVVDALGRMAGVNVYLDPEGLRAEGIGTDEPVTINLSQPVSLRSALNLILEPLRLGYVIQNEVLRITSAQRGNSDVYPRVYNVADLVIPIPNFMPGYNVGMAGALREAQSAGIYGQGMGASQSLPLLVASHEKPGTAANASVLAQMTSSGMLPSTTSRSPQALGPAPGNMGGATQADFDTLIDLITATIAPTTWDTVGGPGSVEGFPTNLSLVISQTQEVHEQIADLLDQLRRLQDLQVTIEVRYITLNDKFFERLGVSFNFNIDDNSNQVAGNALIRPDDVGPSIAYGLDPNGNPTVDYDYTFRQASFGATPPFGGYDATTAANIGFAILSDIEVFMLLQAAEGDNRTNVLQAPKVTLFNGQFGLVMDVSQRPFVMSVVPVVGDFAAAHQPVVVVLNEGTSLSVQAVVSPDRRFVRLTMIPFFSSIGDVSTFTFNGRRTSDTGTAVVDPANNQRAVRNNENNFIEGTTVQLPTFNITTVSTTVSVPDGGTILMGGIKRLSEGRNERGVPMLSKIPYINRLFKNVGIGRETQSLMMMVTPRIIIQEEEEFQQTGYDSSQQ